jgi:hypothetical protein
MPGPSRLDEETIPRVIVGSPQEVETSLTPLLEAWPSLVTVHPPLISIVPNPGAMSRKKLRTIGIFDIEDTTGAWFKNPRILGLKNKKIKKKGFKY